MRVRWDELLSGLGALVLATSVTVVPVPSFAATSGSDCICILSPASGPVGSVSALAGDVFVTGTDGDVAASVGTDLYDGSVLSTGAGGTATATFGDDCKVALEGSMSLIITSTDGGLCVAKIDESLETAGDNTGLMMGAGAALIGGTALLVVGTGTKESASQ